MYLFTRFGYFVCEFVYGLCGLDYGFQCIDELRSLGLGLRTFNVTVGWIWLFVDVVNVVFWIPDNKCLIWITVCGF